MIWNSWGSFWSMGGYGLYVWGSYAVCVAFIALEALMAWRRFAKAREQATARGEKGAT
jgi:heme exporter protein D